MRLIFLTLLFIAAYGLSASAQSLGGAFDGIGNTEDPIQIEADKLEVLDAQNTALLTGNVSVVQGTTILNARQIKVSYVRGAAAKKSKTGIRQIEASGKVAVRSKDSTATADKAVVDMVAETVVMTGNVSLSQGANIVTGCVATVNLKTSVSEIKPCKSASTSGNGRVKLLLSPKNTN